MCQTTPVHVAPVAQNVANMCTKNHSKVALTNTQKYVNSFVGCTKYEIYEQTTWNLTPYKSDQLTLQLKLYFMFDTTMPVDSLQNNNMTLPNGIWQECSHEH